RYTLNLKIQDRSIDPVEDFLFNTRSGHCERFATALVLMLRGVGVPAQFVQGYHGCERVGSGQYRILESDAHAWAEVLLPHGSRWHWQAYDPSPTANAGDGDAAGHLLA